MQFVKMHGIGNDYIFIDCFHETPPENPGALAVQMARYHTGIGSDGLALILPSEDADARMRLFNADGSEAPMCGNGIRCVGKYLYDSGLRRKETLRVDTNSGVKILHMEIKNGVAVGATVDMGEPVADAEQITVKAAGRDWTLRRVDVGSKHGVCFLDALPGDALFRQAGAELERNEAFPDRANIEFCQLIEKDRIAVRVWERGSGETMACGTGACAVTAAAILSGLTGRVCRVDLPGGALSIEWKASDNHIYMTGPAQIAFIGEWRETI